MKSKPKRMKSKDEIIYGWHFVGETLLDRRPVPEDGVWLRHDGPMRMCVSGLHFSPTPFEALHYAPGDTLCRVALRGDVQIVGDKGIARERRIVQRMEATDLLYYFARMQAISVVHLWESDPPDVVLDYLMTGDDGIRDAARAAAWAAADAARATAWDAAWAAADAARAAAWAAAAAAWSTALAAAASDFNALVYECFGVTA